MNTDLKNETKDETKHYVVRSYSGGVWYGTIKFLKGDVCILTNARNIWNWSGASCLSQVAKDGIKSGKVGALIDDPEGVYITQVCNVIPMTEKAVDVINNISAWSV